MLRSQKNDNTETRFTYAKDTGTTDSLRGIRICHTVTFNNVGNAVPFYTTVYGISEEDLPTEIFSQASTPSSSLNFATVVANTAPTQPKVTLYF